MTQTLLRKQIENYIRAGYSGLYIVSHEEQRIEAEIRAVAESITGDDYDGGYGLYSWSYTTGILEHKGERASVIPDTQEPVPAVQEFLKLPDHSILLLRDVHIFLGEQNPLLFRALKDALFAGRASNKTLIIVGCRLALPPELEKEITVIEFALPGRSELNEVMRGVARSAKVAISEDVADAYIDAASGLTTTEAADAFALSIIEHGEVVAKTIQRQKSATIKKTGILEIVDSEVKASDIGGLEILKSDLFEQQNLFSKKARDFGLSSPRGKLIIGQPGTGKSLTAQATASIFNLPLIKLEAGRLFDKHVGQSEANWRSAFATVKACAPCILWIDEVDGLFAGAKSSGETDSGVTARVVKAILQDMQSNSDGIFYFFTANDVDVLPDPLIDRLDVYSVDLPNQTERESILAIHIAKRGRKAKSYDVPAIARALEGFSGRQIEQVWIKALTIAFNKDREPKNSDLVEASTRFVATAKLMSAQIEARRKRLENRAINASLSEVATASTTRKLAIAA